MNCFDNTTKFSTTILLGFSRICSSEISVATFFVSSWDGIEWRYSVSSHIPVRSYHLWLTRMLLMVSEMQRWAQPGKRALDATHRFAVSLDENPCTARSSNVGSTGSLASRLSRCRSRIVPSEPVLILSKTPCSQDRPQRTDDGT